MKRLYYCLAGLLIAGIIFSGCYYYSYRQALEHFNRRANKVDPSILQSEIEIEQDLSKKQMEEVIEATTKKQEVVLVDTQYILQEFDVVTNQTTEEIKNIPEYLLGLTREEVIAYLNVYMHNLTLDEIQKGLLSFELVSFSSDKIIVKKTYNQDLVPYKYCMVVREGMLVVYHCDKKTVYEYTGIYYKDLPEEEQAKLMDGIYIESDEELYGILENYSS